MSVPRHALALVAALALCACAPRCRNQVVRRIPGPDGTLDAVLYYRSCGAADDTSTAVAVIPHDADLPDLPTNVLGLSRRADVSASWTGTAGLRLVYPHSAGVVGRMDRSIDGVTVQFDPH